VRRGLLEELEPPFLDLHAAEWLPDGSFRIRDDARRFENWETYYAGKIGLGVAADYALELGLDAIRGRIDELATGLRRRLETLDGVTVQDRGETLAALVTFTVAGRSATEVERALAAERINVSVSAASSAQLDLGARGLEEVVRASVHYYNSADELDRLVAAVRAAT
jgi:cysteine desulfurase / selenocysteine lyase